MANLDTQILIIGAGTFGLSTAYHLARSGYKSITVLEKGDAIPSPLTAANDLNKIIRAEYEDPYYTGLALEAMHEWTTNPVFSPHYHQVGYLLANSSAASEKSKLSLAKSFKSIESHPAWKGKITPVQRRDDIRAAAPALNGPMDGWVGYFNRFAGYAHSANALKSVYQAVLDMGVVAHCGEGVDVLVYEDCADGSKKCIGAKVASGKTFLADTVVLTVGASLAAILPQVGRQVTAKAWSVAHIQLTEDEASRLAGIPVTYARDLGFFFEPDRETRQLKICPSGAGYTNLMSVHGSKHSLPPRNNDIVPEEDERRIRKLIRQTIPELAERPLICKHVCWCADSADSDFIIDVVPGTQGLVVASGDSGHGFKMLPTIGHFIMDAIEKGSQNTPRWKWKEGSDASGNVSWRTGEVMDLSEVLSTV
ncbi:L-saccharopine oxidase [Cytospora mali]|uniref:L-saccharopine oxidase n=1 Tax=Cytospora mali TaxID=578113 RepID=A0A194UUM5_CYTMA|nr:L-saccharopine oxidase [Valsa mali var. pyri (nom. inval.)]